METISRNYEDWNIEEIFPEKKGGILKLNYENMKEASKTMKEKGIKTSHLKKLSEMGLKLPIDHPCFQIQVNAISPMEGNEKVTPPIDVSYVNDFDYHNNPEENSIRMSIMENSHGIKFCRENLNASMGEVRRIIKRCERINNQVEQNVSLQNQL